MANGKDAYYGDRNKRPPRPKFVKANVPAALRGLARWVGWRFEWKDDEGRWTKVPLDPNKGCLGLAKTNTPATWGEFDATGKAVSKAIKGFADVDGMGYVFHKGDGMFGLDIDGCRNPETGELTPLAKDLIRQLGTYAEVSPSGLGVKLIGRGSLPKGSRGRKVKFPDGQDLEAYGQGRYFTVTGQILQGCPADLTECGAAFTEILAEHFGKAKPAGEPAEPPATDGGSLTDDEIIDRITRTAKNAADGNRLWRGDTSGHGGDDSAADLALCNLIAFYAGPDPSRIDTIFRRSGLYREKWDRTDYQSATIGKALEGRSEFYSPSRGKIKAPAAGAVATETPGGGFALTDYGNAQRLVHRHGKNIKYAEEIGQWYVWDGKRWKTRPVGALVQLAKDTIRAIPAELKGETDQGRRQKILSHALASESGRAIREAVKLAQSEPGIAIEPADLDANRFLFNCKNGTVDLRTGELLPHRRDDLLTKCSPVDYDPKAACPVWESFLARVFGSNPVDPADAGDTDLIAFIKRLMGYGLTGSVSEQILPILWGGGSNGKTTLLNVVREIMGKGYAGKAPRGLLMEKHSESHPVELTVLFGARVVIASESKRGQRMSAELVKDLTGGEAITARYMRENFFEFEPTHKLYLCTNHKPRIPDSDDGIWRRVILIPFNTKFWNPAAGEVGPDHLKRDNTLSDRLKAEYPGVLAWMVAGCVEWIKEGLGRPQAVRDETESYRLQEDNVGDFLAECCRISNAAGDATLKAVYARFCAWCSEGSLRAMSKNDFAADLRGRNVVVRNGSGNKVVCKGLDLISDTATASTLEDFNE